MKLYIGADHRGFALKEMLKKHLAGQGVEVVDKGAFAEDPADDYPDFAKGVATAVAAEVGSRGILICGSGMGMDVAANKIKGARASIGYSLGAVAHGRAHDDVNILVLAADALVAGQAQAFVDEFITTPFGGSERDVRRIEKIKKLEHED